MPGLSQISNVTSLAEEIRTHPDSGQDGPGPVSARHKGSRETVDAGHRPRHCPVGGGAAGGATGNPRTGSQGRRAGEGQVSSSSGSTGMA